jgi:L-proline amide hydrolase
MRLWVEGANALRAELTEETRAALDRHEADGTIDDPEYLAATQVFYERHVCRVVPMPQDFVDSERQMEAEPTVYHTMNGVNEFFVTGTLADWSVIDRLDAVAVPTLVVAGEFDEATPSTWAPFVERIPDVRQHVFPGASHCSHLEQPEAFRGVIADFLAQHDPS